MRASRLLELLVLLQLRGAATAPELAERLEVSVRTVYRDVEALMQAGVPITTEPGRNGGIRLRSGEPIATLPLDEVEARAALLAAVPAVADQLGIRSASATPMLLAALAPRAGTAARAVRDRLLIEPADWFRPPDDVPHLAAIAEAVWESKELRVRYERSVSAATHLVRPLGLILKADTWYLYAGMRSGSDRLFRVSRVVEASVLDHRFERPAGFDLATAWEERKRRFLASIPEYPVRVRVAPDAEPLLGMLQEGSPDLPLPQTTERDRDGWALVDLRFERPDSAARLLLQLGPQIEVLAPPEFRTVITEQVHELASLYGTHRRAGSGRVPRER